MTEAEDLYSSRIVNCVFNVFLSYTAIMLNTVTILALRKTSSLPKPLKTLLLSLAVSDLSVGLVVQPLYIARLVMEVEQMNENNTNIVNIIQSSTRVVLTYASFVCVTALSADRFLAIHLHLRYLELVTHKRVVAAVSSIWVLSAFISLTKFWVPTYVRVSIVLTIEVVCYTTTTFSYYKIYLAVRHHKNEIQALQLQEVAQNSETISNFARLRKSAVGTFYVYLAFLACYLPNSCFLIAFISNGHISLGSDVHNYTSTLMYLNSSLNPLIYCWKMRHVRHAIMNILQNIHPNRN